MYVRSAYWIGRPRAGEEARFRAMIDGEIVPAMRRFPGVSAVKALWPEHYEDDPPQVYLQVLVEFARPEDRDTMAASSERAALRPQIKEAIALFEGAMSHVEGEMR